MTYLTIKEASNYLQVPKSVIYSFWKNIGGHKIGRHIRISRESIDDYMARKEDQEMVHSSNVSRQVLHGGRGLQKSGRGTKRPPTFEERAARGKIPWVTEKFRRSIRGVPEVQ